MFFNALVLRHLSIKLVFRASEELWTFSVSKTNARVSSSESLKPAARFAAAASVDR